MIRLARPLLFALLSGLALLVPAGPGHAQYRVGRRAAFPPNRMPGWDWWRIYPWSPYNYGRNPYNPAWVPYPYYAPYPYYTPYPDYTPSTTSMYTPGTPGAAGVAGTPPASSGSAQLAHLIQSDKGIHLRQLFAELMRVALR